MQGLRASRGWTWVMATVLVANAAPVALGAAGGTDASPAVVGNAAMERTTLQPGVHVLHRPAALREAAEPNLLVIEGPRDLIVVDALGSVRATEHALALIAAFSDKPVGALIQTHRHGDPAIAAATLHARFPDAEVIDAAAVHGERVLIRGDHTVHVVADAAGGLAVWLPGSRVLAADDATLAAELEHDARVPGHGGVEWGGALARR